MRWLEGEHHESDDPATWMPVVWTLVVILGAVFAATLALPGLPGYIDGPVTARSLFHPEWLVLTTLLVLPLYRAARASWRAALLVVPVACMHVLYVADTAVATLHEAGLTSRFFAGWYVVAFAQAALFVVVGARGACRDIIDRRWVRSMQRLAALPPPVRGTNPDPGPGQRPPQPPPRQRDEGFAA